MCEVVLSVLPFVAFVVTRLCQAQADYLRSWISILESKLCDSGSACEFCWACCYGVSDGLLGGSSVLPTPCEQVDCPSVLNNGCRTCPASSQSLPGLLLSAISRLNRPAFPRRLQASQDYVSRTLSETGHPQTNVCGWGCRTSRCS